VEASVVGSLNIRDGLIASYKSRKVRVRISDQIAVITIKGPRRGIARAEYEYEIPVADAELIMSNICGDETLEKQRYLVEHEGTIWHIDAYGGILKGVVIAEIELKQEDQKFVLPPWIGKEVTGNEFYNTRRSIWRRRVVPLGLEQGCRNEVPTLDRTVL
jgi:CYTH domain-containing protein